MNDTIGVNGITETEKSTVLLEVAGRDRSEKGSYVFDFLQNRWNTTIPVPQDFQDSEGGVRAYAWNAESGYEAHGFVPFQIGQSFFDSLQTIPPRPSWRDSIRFTVVAEDPDGLNRVWCKFIAPYQDTLQMISLNESCQYRTARAVGPFPPGTTLEFSFIAENDAGASSESDRMIITLPTLPDIRITALALGGMDCVVVEATIRNFGAEETDGVPIRFESPSGVFIGADTVSATGYGEATVSVPFSHPGGSAAFMIIADPDSIVSESNESNNSFRTDVEVNRFNVTPERGTLCSAGSDTVGMPGKVRCAIPPGAVPQARVLLIEAGGNSNGTHPSMEWQSMEEMIRLSFVGLPEEFVLSKEAVLLFTVGSEDTVQIHKPYRWEGSIRRWILCPFTRFDSVVALRTDRLGFFSMQSASDVEPPWIEVQAENQPFAMDSYVPKNPRLTVVVQDASGVDVRPGKIMITLDDVLQESNSVSVPDSIDDPTNVAVSFRPSLQSGEHTIFIAAGDVHGNVRQTERIRFKVETQFEIQYLGNHPNPFRRETVFVYVLTDAAERISLKIYTVAGRLIRTIEDPDMGGADYHEVVWDGRDAWGEEVANGVYFFRLKAEGNRKMREVTGKIARLR